MVAMAHGDYGPDLDQFADAEVGLADFVGEQGVLLGAGSAVMLQLAMKGVGLGVAEHSTTLTRPLDRLRTTLTYIYVMAWGTPEEQREIARLVNRMHTKVRSAGRYSAFDQDLQLWVAATLVYSGEQMYEKLFGRLDPASRERVYRESWIYGTALQVPEEMWPPTRDEFDVYFENTMRTLESDPIIIDYAHRLLSSRGAPPLMRLALPLQSLMTRGNLDPRVRELLRLRWSRIDQFAYDAFWAVLPPVYRLVPRKVRQAGAHRVLNDMRRRLAAGRRVI